MDPEMERVIVSKGSPFNIPSQLSILSYNILAPVYVRPIDSRTGKVQEFAAFAWAEPADEVLSWEARAPKIIQELKTSCADVICLQEIQFESDGRGGFELPSFLRDGLQDYSYRIGAQSSLREIADRNKRVLNCEAPVGNAVLWRTSRLDAKDVDESIKDANTRVAVCFSGKLGSELEHLGSTVVVSVHLDATSEEQRVKQLSRALEQARLLGTRNVIIAGDMNTECLPGSCVSAMLNSEPEPSLTQLMQECSSAYRLVESDETTSEASEGQSISLSAVQPNEELMASWDALRKQAIDGPMKCRINLSRVDTGETRAAYDHGKSTGPCTSWKLDHIFYNPGYLSCTRRWSTLEDDSDSVAKGLPNHNCPSDHLPIAACFEVCSDIRPLSLDERNALVEEWQSMQTRFESEKDEASRRFDAELASLEEISETSASQSGEEFSAAAGNNSKKQKKSKKGKPSEAVMSLMRKKRETLKVMTEVHETFVVERVQKLSDVELDIAENFCLFGLKVPSLSSSGGKKK